MKTLSPALQAHLDSGTTTLAWCWRVTRRDSVRLGFTDHDRDLTFDGTSFEAASGFTASEIKDSIGLAIDNLDVQSALSTDTISEDDLAHGLFDDADVEIWRVNWSDPSQRVLMRKGSLGEVRRAGSAFTAEVRGLAHYLNQPKGRLYQYGCDADLGDIRCGVALTNPRLRGTGVITAVTSARAFAASGLAAFSTDWFTRGLVTITSGVNLGRTMEVRTHALAGATAALTLWQSLAHTPIVGDTFTVTAGCDKQFATCRDRFANAARFRGFPHMPGNDFITRIARPGA
jgi:uncharacterized phage protein (TIGR02218 family)